MKRKMKSSKLLLIVSMILTISLTAVPSYAIETQSYLTYGDLNGDKNVNSIDYSILQSYILGIRSNMSETNWKYTADLNCDKKINAIDLAIFRKYLLGMIYSIPDRQNINYSKQIEVNVFDSFDIQRSEGGVVGQRYLCVIEDESIVRLTDEKYIHVPLSVETIHTMRFEAQKEGETTITLKSTNNFNPDIIYTVKVNSTLFTFFD